jgi:hypothetical protein
MLQIDLVYNEELGGVEHFTRFETLNTYSLEELTNDEKGVYNAMISLMGNRRVTIENTPNDGDMLVFRNDIWDLNPDKSISDIYEIVNVDYDNYNNTEKLIINNFINMLSNK